MSSLEDLLQHYMRVYTPQEMVHYRHTSRNWLTRDKRLSKQIIPAPVLVMLVMEGVLPSDFFNN